jgi:microcystin-dependent protein
VHRASCVDPADDVRADRTDARAVNPALHPRIAAVIPISQGTCSSDKASGALHRGKRPDAVGDPGHSPGIGNLTANSLLLNGTAVTTDITDINQALSTASANVTAANLNDLTDGGSTTLHVHSGGSSTIPAGSIAIWSGTIATIPTGWALCDGTSGTPDMTNRFVVGAANGVNGGGTGGASTITLVVANLPTHTHTPSSGSAGTHSHTISTDTPSHTHTALERINTGSTQYDTGAVTPSWYTGGSNTTGTAGGHSHTLNTLAISNQTHSHTFTTDTMGAGGSIDNRPTFYEVAYIQKQ